MSADWVYAWGAIEIPAKAKETRLRNLERVSSFMVAVSKNSGL